MVKIALLTLVLLSSLGAYSLEKEIIGIMGKGDYHTKKGLISVLFKDKVSFLKGNGTDLVKVTKTLKENKLLDLKLGNVTDIELTFATHQTQALLFIKIIKEVLASSGYSHTLTTKAMRDDSGFLWNIKLRSSAMIDPYLITHELEKRGAMVTDIKRYSKSKYRYNVDISDAYVKSIKITDEKELRLKKALNPYWIDVENARVITIISVAGNIWHPYVVFYDKELHAINNYTKERRSYNISLKVPRDAKYIKISDLYTLQNIKRGLKVSITKKR